MSDSAETAPRAPSPRGTTPAAQGTSDPFEPIRRRIDERLERFLTDAERDARELAREAAPIVSEVRALTMRGGKRLRPALVAAAVECVAPCETVGDALVDVGAAIELLQTYLLIHDDLMDGDEIRRGGPTVHVALARAYGNKKHGDDAAILAGDIASALAQELIATTNVPAARLHGVARAYATMQREVVLGQTLDVLDSADADAKLDLKTGSYTVRGPLALGHALAGGSDAAWSALLAFSRPLGIAFQLRDDLIGSYGDARETGKSGGSDIRAGKRTTPVRYALERLAPEAARELESLLGQDRDDALARARALMDSVDTVGGIEARIAALRAEALAALETPALRAEGRAWLTRLAGVLTDRRK